MEQGTPEWFAERCGKVTASRVADVIAKTKTGSSATRANYIAQLVAEILTGKPQETFSNGAMQRGTETEPFARAAYETRTGVFVDQGGFIHHPTIKRSGASPDGLIGDSGLIEIKCPNTSTHLAYLLAKEVPEKYKPQMAWQMACTGRKWCDFVSFDDRLPERHQLFVKRYEIDAAYVDMLESEVKKFLAEVEAVIVKLDEQGQA